MIWKLVSLSVLFLMGSCGSSDSAGGGEAGPDAAPVTQTATIDACELVASGHGPSGDASGIRAEKLVTGLTVPWGIAFISDRDFLVSERGGSVRLVQDGILRPTPVLRVPDVAARREGGLLGIAAHPRFSSNRFYYIYYTSSRASGDVNRIARYRLREDLSGSDFDRFIFDGIPSGLFHDGGRLKFGPDGMLYAGTGDGRIPSRSQDISTPAGKILRLSPDGGIPGDNPIAGNPLYVLGVRNIQGFDWINRGTMVIADHGPTGELGRSGHDEVTIAGRGANLGWPTTWQCAAAANRARPFLVWRNAAPPGGLVYFTGSFIPAWSDSILIATLKSEHLHRVVLESTPSGLRMARHEVYFKGRFGRLRDVVQAPDGSLLMTTSNCDGRGTCGRDRDAIIRVTKD